MYNKRAFAVMPNILGGIFEDVMNNNCNHISNEMKFASVPVNIFETDKSYDLHVVAPGLKKEDFKLGIDKNILNISFEQKEENKDAQEGKWIRSEYKMKSFKRSFTLNEKIDATKIAAKYADGVLVVTLPKKEVAAEPAAQEIPVN
jgi:HSP20 family protein